MKPYQATCTLVGRFKAQGPTTQDLHARRGLPSTSEEALWLYKHWEFVDKFDLLLVGLLLDFQPMPDFQQLRVSLVLSLKSFVVVLPSFNDRHLISEMPGGPWMSVKVFSVADCKAFTWLLFKFREGSTSWASNPFFVRTSKKQRVCITQSVTLFELTHTTGSQAFAVDHSKRSQLFSRPSFKSKWKKHQECQLKPRINILKQMRFFLCPPITIFMGRTERHQNLLQHQRRSELRGQSIEDLKLLETTDLLRHSVHRVETKCFCLGVAPQ